MKSTTDAAGDPSAQRRKWQKKGQYSSTLHQNILNQANQQAIAKLSFDTDSLEFKAGLTLHLF